MPIADDADGVRRWERAQDDLVASAQAGSVSASPAAGPMEFLPQVRSPPLPPQTEDHGPSWEAQLEELMLMEAIQLSLREAEGAAGGGGGEGGGAAAATTQLHVLHTAATPSPRTAPHFFARFAAGVANSALVPPIAFVSSAHSAGSSAAKLVTDGLVSTLAAWRRT